MAINLLKPFKKQERSWMWWQTPLTVNTSSGKSEAEGDLYKLEVSLSYAVKS